MINLKMNAVELIDEAVAALTKNQWTERNLEDLDDKVLEEIWDMYEHTYKTIGLIFPNLKALTNKYKISLLIDVDKDPFPDAFVIYKETRFGKKTLLSGSDGSKPAKSALVKHKLVSLKQKGWYVEASHRMADILSSNGINIVGKQEDVEKVLGKKVKWVGEDGKYERTVGSSLKVVKQLFGLPKI